MAGILVVLNDCAVGAEDFYEEWYQEEHLKERIGVNGFIVARRFEAIVAKRQYLTTYEVHSTDVLRSTGYLERLANPSARTVQMMITGFKNVCRTVCERQLITGSIRGGVIVIAALPSASGFDIIKKVASYHKITSRLCHSEVWKATEWSYIAPQTEEKLRGEDDKIGACLALEFLRTKPAQAAAELLQFSLPSAEIGIYRLVSYLRSDEN